MNTVPTRRALFALGFWLFAGLPADAAESSGSWPRHVIDATSRGADGVRLADINDDGRLDIATGWEEGGLVRVYVHPGPKRVRRAWPAVTVGQVKAPEDALFVDVDRDGRLDVLSCCEGQTRAVFVHWSPADSGDLLRSARWSTEQLPDLPPRRAWMYACVVPTAHPAEVNLAIGSKGEQAGIWLLSTERTSRDLKRWEKQQLRLAGWIMSLIAADMDNDGDFDLVLSDRTGPRRGAFWLENPGEAARARQSPWHEHPIGALNREAMFLTLGDVDADGLQDVVIMTLEGSLIYCRRRGQNVPVWQTAEIGLPDGHRRGKGIAVGDVDGDALPDLVVTTEDGCVAWRRSAPAPTAPAAQWLDIGGSVGYKFDRVELLDLDEDGDLDVLTCEERDNLGVVWYENP